MAYDSVREVLVLFGGGGPSYLGDTWELRTSSPCDMNCDGDINAFDIEPFLGIVFDGDDPCRPCNGDANGDGTVDGVDIEPFLDCLFPYRSRPRRAGYTGLDVRTRESHRSRPVDRYRNDLRRLGRAAQRAATTAVPDRCGGVAAVWGFRHH